MEPVEYKKDRELKFLSSCQVKKIGGGAFVSKKGRGELLKAKVVIQGDPHEIRASAKRGRKLATDGAKKTTTPEKKPEEEKTGSYKGRKYGRGTEERCVCAKKKKKKVIGSKSMRERSSMVKGETEWKKSSSLGNEPAPPAGKRVTTLLHLIGELASEGGREERKISRGLERLPLALAKEKKGCTEVPAGKAEGDLQRRIREHAKSKANPDTRGIGVMEGQRSKTS